jgi:hypothetical protein
MFFKAFALAFAIEAGFISGGIWNYSERNTQWVEVGALYVDLEARGSLGPLYVGGAVSTHFTPTSLINYSPFQNTYEIGAGLEFDGVTLGYRHACYHPLQPYATVIGREIKPKYEGGYNQVFMRIETK